MSTQKALYIPEKQAPFKVGDAPLYEPGPKEVLVKNFATALNPVDWKIQKYDFMIESYPTVLGTDSSGVIKALGEGVTEFAVGDKV